MHWEGPGENGETKWRAQTTAARDPTIDTQTTDTCSPVLISADIVRLSDDHLLTVFRVDSCHPYWKSRSTDGGISWSPPEALPFGSARPKLLRMPNGQPLLAGGRPGLWLWLGDQTGSTWTGINVCAEHNNLLPDDPSWHYSESGEIACHASAQLQQRGANLVAGGCMLLYGSAQVANGTNSSQ